MPRGEAVVVSMDKVLSRPVLWLWPPRVPIGKVTLLAGDPGLGKSYVTLDLASQVSRGLLPPIGSEGADGSHGDVLILSAEDDVQDTIRPRLERMMANMSRVHVLRGLAWEHDAQRKLLLCRLDRDLGAVAEAMHRLERPRLLIIDPISAYLGEKDANSNSEVRELLAQLHQFAASFHIACVCVTHLNKNGQGRAMYRAMGSLAFAAAARSVLLVAKHPDDPKTRVIATVKNNLTAEARTIAYRIEDGRVGWLEDEVRLTADDIEGFEASGGAEKTDALEEAADWLGDRLRDGPRAASAVIEQAEREGISATTLKRAKRRLGVVARRAPGEDTVWNWALPQKAVPA